MAEQPVITALRRTHPDVVQVLLRLGDVERTYDVRADRRPPLTALVADDGLQAQVRDWPELYRDLMARCGALLGDRNAAVAA